MLGFGSLALAAALVTGTGAGDRAPLATRVTAMRAAAVRPAAWPALPSFVLFGWCSPPPDSTTAARIDELTASGMNVLVPAWADSGRVSDNLARLAWAHARGARAIVWDQRLERVVLQGPQTYRWADSVVASYRDDPAFLAYYLGDEPPASQFDDLRQYFALLRTRDPLHPAWNNLRGRVAFSTRAEFEAHVRSYVAQVQPSVLCNDQYDLTPTGDLHQLVENVASLAAIARENGLPFWGIVLITGHTGYRTPTAGELQWQVAQWLSYGARGIGYFTYWTPGPSAYFQWQPAMIGPDGQRTVLYDEVQALNVHARAIGETLVSTQWLFTEYSGSVPPGGTPFAPDGTITAVEGRATLGVFADTTGAPIILIANADSSAFQEVALTFSGWRDVDYLKEAPGVWRNRVPVERINGDTRLSLGLRAGQFVLIRVGGVIDTVGAGPGDLAILSAPNPARGLVRFGVSGVSGVGRLELLDLSGRRVWGRDITPDAQGIEWRGVRDDGGKAPAGAYFARIEDARSVRVRRVIWLGAP